MIPNLKDIALGPLTLVDVGTLPAEEHQRALLLGRRALTDLIAKTRQTQICNPMAFAVIETAAVREFLAANPEATRAEIRAFRDTFDLKDDSECDIRLDEKALAIYRGVPADRDLMGVFFLYNIATMSTRGQSMRVTAYPAPGFPFQDSVRWANQMKALMLGLLETPLRFVDGGVLDILAWKFPTRADHAWAGELWAERLLAGFRDDGYILELVNGILFTFKRKAGRAG